MQKSSPIIIMRTKIGKTRLEEDDCYWSSSEYSWSWVWNQDFGNGSMYFNGEKANNIYYVLVLTF